MHPCPLEIVVKFYYKGKYGFSVIEKVKTN